MIENDNYKIVLYSIDHDEDQLLLNVLEKAFKTVVVINSIDCLIEQLVEPLPKLVFISGETFQISLSLYHRALYNVPDKKLCEHFFIPLIQRCDEEEAFKAFSSGVVDNYLVSKPLYEKHRPIVICNYFLNQLGLLKIDHQPQKYLQSQANIDPIEKKFITEGIEKKERIKQGFVSMITAMDQALDRAALQLKGNSQVDLDIKLLTSILSKIKPDPTRPVLINLQGKAINLLQALVGDFLMPPIENTVLNSSLSTSPQTRAPLDRTMRKERVDNTPRILLVEDDPISIHCTKQLLSKYALTLEIAYTGRWAIACLDTTAFDLVFLDLNLPDTNGIYILDQLYKKQGPNNNTPIIMLTGNKNKTTIKKAIQLGGSGWLVKPLTQEALVKLFQQYAIPLIKKDA